MGMSSELVCWRSLTALQDIWAEGSLTRSRKSPYSVLSRGGGSSQSLRASGEDHTTLHSLYALCPLPPQGAPGDLGAPGPSGARVSQASCCPMEWPRLSPSPEQPSCALSFPSRVREVSPVSVVCKVPLVLLVPEDPTVLLAMMVLR